MLIASSVTNHSGSRRLEIYTGTKKSVVAWAKRPGGKKKGAEKEEGAGGVAWADYV